MSLGREAVEEGTQAGQDDAFLRRDGAERQGWRRFAGHRFQQRTGATNLDPEVEAVGRQGWPAPPAASRHPSYSELT
ncbi:MAG TPA: hypothetical protein VGJ56_21030, partial [Reyranella sp.]